MHDRRAPQPAAPAGVNDALLDRQERTGRPAWRIYEPAAPAIVFGAGGRAKTDAHVERARADGVPLLRRRGGGGAVVLAPGQLVLALAAAVDSPFRNREHLCAINGWVAEALAGLGVSGVRPRGICDLAIGDRKVLGASLFRRRHVLFYQSSLLVCCDVALFGRYLRYPLREPDYRAGRAHAAFCTTLAEQGYALAPAQVAGALRPIVERRLALPGLGISGASCAAGARVPDAAGSMDAAGSADAPGALDAGAPEAACV